MILVLGGGGQLGQELVRLAADEGVALIALRRREADLDDVESLERVFARAQPTVIVNAAGFTGVDRAESEIGAARRANAIGPARLAGLCSRLDLPLIHLSTDYVFDGRKGSPYVEDDPVSPLNVYGQTKAEGEAAVRAGLARHLILRTSWLFGAFGHNFCKTILRLARERDELRVVDDQWGSPTAGRTLAEAILRAAPRLAAEHAVAGTYHFTGGGVTSWCGFAARIVAAQAAITGRRPHVTAIATQDTPTMARRPTYSALDCDRFATTFGLRAEPWTDAVDRIVRDLVRPEA